MAGIFIELSKTAYISELGTCVVLRVSCPESVGPWPGQRRSIAFSKGPPKTKMARTRKEPNTTICHSATAKAAPINAVTHTQSAVVSPYVMTFAISDNDACAQKPDSGHDTLDNAARVGAAAILDRKNCPYPHEHNNAHGSP